MTADEIHHAAALIRAIWPAAGGTGTGIDIQFKVVTLSEPAKAEMVPYLEAEHQGRNGVKPQRRAWVNYYLRNTVCTISRTIVEEND